MMNNSRTIAIIIEEDCTGCFRCMVACPFDAIDMNDDGELAIIIEDGCRGCMRCAPACPTNAIKRVQI